MVSRYDEMYLEDAMRNLGEAFDYATNSCKMGADEFARLFVSTGYAECFMNGNPKYISGMSGTEMVMDLITSSGRLIEFPKPRVNYNYSCEYWAGWILAYYQWMTGKSYNDIFETVPMSEICKMYYPLHEAPEDKFVEVLNQRLEEGERISKLQRQRKIAGLSQSELSKKSGVNYRTLQQYESKAKDIGKASVKAVQALATALSCKVEDIV